MSALRKGYNRNGKPHQTRKDLQAKVLLQMQTRRTMQKERLLLGMR